jgi:hypothetical protein
VARSMSALAACANAVKSNFKAAKDKKAGR